MGELGVKTGRFSLVLRFDGVGLGGVVGNWAGVIGEKGGGAGVLGGGAVECVRGGIGLGSCGCGGTGFEPDWGIEDLGGSKAEGGFGMVSVLGTGFSGGVGKGFSGCLGSICLIGGFARLGNVTGWIAATGAFALALIGDLVFVAFAAVVFPGGRPLDAGFGFDSRASDSSLGGTFSLMLIVLIPLAS